MPRQPGLPKIADRLPFLRIGLQKIVKGLARLIELALLRQHASQSRNGLNTSRINVKRSLISLASLVGKIIVGQ